MIILSLALAAAPQQLPARAYQPRLVDPGLHGGFPAGHSVPDHPEFKTSNNPGDVTVDGRIAVLYRLGYDANAPSGAPKLRPTLQVCAFDPEHLQEDADGYIDAYFDAVTGPGFAGAPAQDWGDDYAISSLHDSHVLYFSPPTTNGTPQCAGCPPLDLSNLPNSGRTRPLAVTLEPLDPASESKGLNPYPSDENGVYDESGDHLTYELWLVTPHYPVPAHALACTEEEEDETTSWLCKDGIWVGRNGDEYEPVLGARDLTVILDVSADPDVIVDATLGDFTELRTIGLDPVRGIEPTLTADGRLMIFNGDGADNVGPNSEITYVYNEDPCSLTGWEHPKPIAAMYDEGPEFKERYPLARQPIVEPDYVDDAFTGFTDDSAYGADGGGVYEDLPGSYPWVSKDGSFFMATHVFSKEANPKQGLRSGLMACGDITGGYIKNVDDRALNPTRHGAPLIWPVVGEDAGDLIYDEVSDSQMTTFFSTGLKPGPWQPFLGEDHPVPSMEADQRVPVLPVFVHRTRMYGDVRFEEADGNYILYLACNEAFKRNDPSNEHPSLIDPLRTPDSSGSPNRPSCVLRPGASFPKELFGHYDDPSTWKALSQRVWNDSDDQCHENIGFKGQAILFAAAGYIDVEYLPTYSEDLTLQAFVKPVETWSSQELPLLTEPGRFQLRLTQTGHFEIELQVKTTVETPGGPAVTIGAKTLTSNYSIGAADPEVYDPGAGWIHVAAVFDGDVDGQSSLRLYLDGAVYDTGTAKDELTWNGTSTVYGPAGGFYVGPRLAGGSTDVANDPVLVLDEVAVSDVARTDNELRRDAFVEITDEFEATWPPAAHFPLHAGLSESDVHWPVGVTYNPRKVLLGEALFEDAGLSSDGSRSCATCHIESEGFADKEQEKALEFGSPPPPNEVTLPFNTPTVLNSAFGTHKMFDGRAESLEDQVEIPLTSGKEMGPQTMQDVLDYLNGVQAYVTAFQQAFATADPAPATQERLAEALAMYQRVQMSPLSEGDTGNLDPLESEGRAIFFGKGRCFACHHGSAFSDDLFHNIATVTSSETEVDGLGGASGRINEVGMLKTPTLRDLELTKPYFHDGSKSELEDVVDHYNGGFLSVLDEKGEIDRFLLPIDLTSGEEAALVAFLEALSVDSP